MSTLRTSENAAHRLRKARGGGLWVGLACIVFLASLLLSWMMQLRLDLSFDRRDAEAIERSGHVLEQLVELQRQQLSSTVGVLSEDARVRAMVMTPTFDAATARDLLADIKASSNASVIAILDAGGAVQAVVGAPELKQVNLGTSALVKAAGERPAARVWAFGEKVGVLAAAPVRLGDQVRALFLIGFQIDDALLSGIERTLGATGAIFVGDQRVASSSSDEETAAALAAAGKIPAGRRQVVAGRFLGGSSRLSKASESASVAWLVPLERQGEQARIARAVAWLPAALAGLMLALVFGLASSQSRRRRPSES